MTQHQKQPYDAALKALLREQTAEMLPHLLLGAELIKELNSEVLKPQPPLRADKVYQIQYRGGPHVFHFELETGANSKMAQRMLSYHALLLEEYGLPVISMIIYPFRTTTAESPLREMSGKQEVLTFHFKVLRLWDLNAQQYLRDHTVTMYPLLPTMQVEDKNAAEEELHMFDDLLKDDPYIQKTVEQAVIEELQMDVVGLVKRRFPALTDLAQKRVTQIREREALREFLWVISTSPDEVSTRWLLNPPAA